MSYPIDSGFLSDRYDNGGLTGYRKTDPRGMELERTVANDYLIVSVGDAKNYLNVNHDNHDEMIEKMIRTATKNCEDYLGLAFLKSTYELYYLWAFDYVKLPLRKQTITEIKTIDIEGNETTLTTDNYVVLGNKDKIIRFKTAVDKSVLITFTAGLADSPNELDTTYQDAIKSQLKFLYARDFKTNIEIEASMKTGLAIEAEVALNSTRQWDY